MPYYTSPIIRSLYKQSKVIRVSLLRKNETKQHDNCMEPTMIKSCMNSYHVTTKDENKIVLNTGDTFNIQIPTTNRLQILSQFFCSVICNCQDSQVLPFYFDISKAPYLHDRLAKSYLEILRAQNLLVEGHLHLLEEANQQERAL